MNAVNDVLLEERPDDVRVVRLNRPDRLNALTPDMVAEITSAMQEERRHRAIVITGNGRAFCAGVYRTVVDAPSLEHALGLKNRTQILANAREDAAKARSAFLEKRPPRYAGR